MPDGTRFVLPDTAARRDELRDLLRDLYHAWGFDQVEVPSLERYDPSHPRAAQSFKLADRDSGVLALRTDFTPALAQLVRAAHPAVAGGAQRPVRYQYAGTVWHAIDPELARTREFTQVGIELIGVSNARADAELIHLARESVRVVGLEPRVEVGNPGFVRAAFDAAGVPASLRDLAADAIDRKDRSDLSGVLAPAGLAPASVDALLAIPDLYGGTEVLAHARTAVPWPAALRELDRLEGVLREFEDDSELMLDLSMARRLSYYTGVTFRAYTPDFGQPLLGGGRYDGALLPAAAGFSLGLERLMRAVARRRSVSETEPLVLALDDAGARRLRAAGVRVVRALDVERAAVRLEARDLGIPFVLVDGRLEAVDPAADAARLAHLEAALVGGSGADA
ncbi:MAG: ATP phosphoribosyltransferase regulatory subunit [Trueperaceae bacterium]|nr:MAG: ATP phosphoribosyltransferase regulatory subunit [Trueperaceae bacterium]